jgi:16S rRNA processing protein RimM
MKISLINLGMPSLEIAFKGKFIILKSLHGMKMTNNLICIAKITKPHGIRGQAKLMSYAEKPEDVFNYPVLYDEKLNEYQIRLNSQSQNMFVITFNNNKSRNLVEEIAGTKLYITREMLPSSNENEYYHADLVGLQVLDTDKNVKGKILEIHNFGAGDIIEMVIPDAKSTIFLPFEEEFIIEINLEQKFLIFDFNKSGI